MTTNEVAYLQGKVDTMETDVADLKRNVGEIRVAIDRIEQIQKIILAAQNKDSISRGFAFLIFVLVVAGLTFGRISEWLGGVGLFVAVVVWKNEKINSLARAVFRVPSEERPSVAVTAPEGQG